MGYNANERKEYEIIRDYYSEKRGKEGVMFVLTNPDGDQTISRFLPKHQMNNNFEWERVKKGDVHFLAAGIEFGDKEKLIVETGFINAKTKYLRNERIYTYRKYTFVLSRKKIGGRKKKEKRTLKF